jgi:hypothetical protein
MTRLYDPLTYRHPRSLDETEDTRFAWWASAENETAQQDQLRMQLTPRDTALTPGIVAMFCAAIVGVIALGLWLSRGI